MAISRGETTTRPVGRALPTWYDDAKFGIFIHWGPFAIPGFAPVDNDDEVSFTEYYAYWMNVPGSATARFHAREYGDLPLGRGPAVDVHLRPGADAAEQGLDEHVAGTDRRQRSLLDPDRARPGDHDDLAEPFRHLYTHPIP